MRSPRYEDGTPRTMDVTRRYLDRFTYDGQHWRFAFRDYSARDSFRT